MELPIHMSYRLRRSLRPQCSKRRATKDEQPGPLRRCTAATVCRTAVAYFCREPLSSHHGPAQLRAPSSVGQSLFDFQRRLGKNLGDPFAGTPITVHRVVWIPAVAQVMPDRSHDFVSIVVHVRQVRSAISSGLPRTDVYRRHSQIRTLANTYTRIADQAPAVAQQAQKIRAFHILKKVNVLRLRTFSKGSDAARSAVGSSVNVGPKP